MNNIILVDKKDNIILKSYKILLYTIWLALSGAGDNTIRRWSWHLKGTLGNNRVHDKREGMVIHWTWSLYIKKYTLARLGNIIIHDKREVMVIHWSLPSWNLYIEYTLAYFKYKKPNDKILNQKSNILIFNRKRRSHKMLWQKNT